MPGRSGDAVIKSKLRQCVFQVVDLHSRRKALAAADAMRAFIACSSLLIKLCAQLSWTLKDMKEFSKRKVQESRDDGDGMKDREEAIQAAAQPELRDGEREARDRDRKEQNERQKIESERL